MSEHRVEPKGGLLQALLSFFNRLLELLLDRRGEAVSRDGVVEAVWPEEAAQGISEQAIDALVRRLRERLAALDPDHNYIHTIRGHGFRLDNR